MKDLSAFLAFGAFLLCGWTSVALLAQAPAPVPSQPSATPVPTISMAQSADLVDRVMFVKSYQSYSSPTYLVSPNTVYSNQVLFVDTLIFQQSGVLLFSGMTPSPSPQQGTAFSGDFYIVAKSIIVKADYASTGPLPEITWGRQDNSNQYPTEVGIASSGSIGGGAGSNGTPGAPGIIGNPGYPGRAAPNLYIFFGSISGPPLSVDLVGQPGGPGGVGQSGGNGGPGQAGRPAIAIHAAFIGTCPLNGGNGGDGGNGGTGGKGGTGGRGGSGGTLVLASSERNITDLKSRIHAFGANKDNPSANDEIQAFLEGGSGGIGGHGGQPGQGGPGGDGGPGEPPCKPGAPGKAGNLGETGQLGDQGPAGPLGGVALVPLPDNLLSTLGIGKNAKGR
jgi:hypothetical protein